MQIRPLKFMFHGKLIVISLLWLVVVFVFNLRGSSRFIMNFWNFRKSAIKLEIKKCSAFLELWKFWVNIWFLEQIFWRKQLVECTCFNGKNTVLSKLHNKCFEATVSLALHHKPPSQNKFKPSSEFISFCIFKSVSMDTFVAIKS